MRYDIHYLCNLAAKLQNYPFKMRHQPLFLLLLQKKK